MSLLLRYGLFHTGLPDLNRLMVRADLDLKRAIYMLMSCEARRQAIFLLFSAMRKNVELNVFRRLNIRNLKMVKVVLSYL